MMKYFKHQMRQNMHPGAAKKLFKRIMPQLCVDNDICPACSADLMLHDESHSPYMRTKDRICSQCDTIYKGGNIATPHRGPDIEPEAFVQKRAAGG